ncbi:MAG: tubulin-like doman-containing protein [Leptothrix sp. (in: b-proteobacteria)]
MNHLMIGLGGTGGRVLAGLRKRLLLQLGSERPAHLALDFLLVDDGTQLGRDNDPLWSVLGHALQLPRRNRLALDFGPQALSQGLLERPALRRGLGDLASTSELPKTLAAVEGGAGQRRLTHWALSLQLARCRDTIETLSRELRERSGRSATTWHLYCHLGDGIGSGLLPAMLQLLQRQAAESDPASRILVYGVLPQGLATPPEPGAAAGHDVAQAHAYATLLELSALAQAGRDEPAAGAHPPADAAAPGGFHLCYLSHDTDSRDASHDGGSRTPADAAERLAEFAFQKVAVLGQRWSQLVQLESAGSAASRFVGLGLQQLGPNERRLREHLSHEQALRVLNHLRYDHWRAALGYVDQPRPAAQAGAEVDEALRQRWGLSDTHLQLQNARAAPTAEADNPTTASGANSTTPGSFEMLWREYEAHFLPQLAALPEAQRLERLHALFEQAWQGGWHGLGVERFYAQADDDLFHLTDARAAGIEADLLQDWRAGRRSLHDCGRLVSALMADLAPRGDQVESRAEQHSAAAAHHEQQLAAIEQRWSGEGEGWAGLSQRLSGATAARRALELGNAATLLRERAIARTHAEACRFAQRHARRMASRLGDLLNLIDAVELSVASLAEQFHAKALATLPERSTSGTADSHADERRRSDEIRQRLLTQESRQTEHAAQLRQELFGILGERANFRTFALELTEDHLCNVLLARSATAVQTGLSPADLPALWSSLAQQWQDQPTRQAQDLRALADGALLGQPALSAGDTPQAALRPGTVPSHWGLISPADAPDELLQSLSTGLAQAITDAVSQVAPATAAAPQPAPLQITDGSTAPARPAAGTALLLDLLHALPATAGRPAAQTLTLLSLAPGLALSDSPWLRQLHDGYERVRLRTGAAAAALHVDGDPSRLPLLITPDAAQQASQARQVLLLAAALGLVHDSLDPATGAPRLLQVRLDADGFELERKVLGRTLADAALTLDSAAVRALRQAIEEADPARTVHDSSRHDALRAAMRNHIEAIRSAAPAAELDAVSLAWNEAARAVMRFVRQEAPL